MFRFENYLHAAGRAFIVHWATGITWNIIK